MKAQWNDVGAVALQRSLSVPSEAELAEFSRAGDVGAMVDLLFRERMVTIDLSCDLLGQSPYVDMDPVETAANLRAGLLRLAHFLSAFHRVADGAIHEDSLSQDPKVLMAWAASYDRTFARCLATLQRAELHQGMAAAVAPAMAQRRLA